MAYEKTKWEPSLFNEQGVKVKDGTPLASTLLNKMEDGIANAAEKKDLELVSQQFSETAETAERIRSQKNLFDLVRAHNRDGSQLLIKIIGDRTFRVAVPLGGEEYAVYTMFKDPNDDYIKLSSGHVSKMVKGYVETEKRNVDSFSGSWVTAHMPSYYTIEAGAKAFGTFTGNRFDFIHFTDNRGGIFKLTVDGKEVATFSTHIDAIPEGEKFLPNGRRRFDGFADGKHDVELEFLGADPDHPPNGGIARGWLYYETRPENRNRTFNVFSESTEAVDKFEVLYLQSNKEFAIRASGGTDSGSTPEFFPEHSGKGTVFAKKQRVLVDGEAITDWTTSGFKPCRSVIIEQFMDAIHPQDGKLAEITETKTVGLDGVSFTSRFDWIKRAYISAGYVAMLPLSREFADKLLTGAGTVYDTTAISGRSYLDAEEDFITDYAAYHVTSETEKQDYALAMRIHNIDETFRRGKAGRLERDEGAENAIIWLEHRSDALQKLYPHTLSQHEFAPGESYTFGASYTIGKLFKAAKLLN